MVPDFDYLVLNADLSNLRNLTQWIRMHPEKAREMGDRGRKFFLKYLAWEPTKRFITQYLSSKQTDNKNQGTIETVFWYLG